MKQKWFQSRTIVFSVISALILMTSAPAFPMYEAGKGGEDKGPVVKVKYMGKGISVAQEKNFTLLLEDGKRLLKEWMDYAAAIEKFKEAEKLATQNRQKSDVYYYLSLAYFASLEERGTKDFTDTVKRLIEVDYYRQLDENECPPQYVAMYNDIKRDYGVLKVLSVPPGADVFFNDSKASEGKTPLTVGYKAGDIKVRVKKGGKQKKDQLTVLAGQETSSPVYSLEGRSSLIYIIGGALVAGAAGAVLLLAGGGEKEVVATTGNLTVNSSPSGALIYMGKTTPENTDQVTPYTFQDLAPGNYIVSLKLESYADYTETAAVTAGQSTTVNPSLTQHTISVTKPAAADQIPLVKKTRIEIEWDLDGGAQAQNSAAFPAQVSVSNLSRTMLQRSRERARSGRSATDLSTGLSHGRMQALKKTGLSRAGNPALPVRSAGSSGWSSRESSRTRPVGLPQNTYVVPGEKGLASQGTANPGFISNVKILLLSGKDFKTSEEIVTDIAGSKKAYTWKVWESANISLKTGQIYKIQVQSVEDSSLFGSSGAFNVVEAEVAYGFQRIIDLKQHNIVDAYGIAVGNNALYVTDSGYDDNTTQTWSRPQRIVKLSKDGNTRLEDKDITPGAPYGIDLDKDGNLYVAEWGAKRIAMYDQNLVFLNKVWTGKSGSISPRGVSVDQDLNVYVNDYGGRKVLKYDKNGNVVHGNIWTAKGTAPVNIHVDDPTKMLYIPDRENERVLRYFTNGSHNDVWKIFPPDASPVDIAVDSLGNVFVALMSVSGLYTAQSVAIVSKDGTLKTTFGFAGIDKAAFAHPTGIAIDRSANDTVYVLDPNPAVLQIKVWTKIK
jgi:lipoprotein-anchoring transpeptidase ErfK/SrfK